MMFESCDNYEKALREEQRRIRWLQIFTDNVCRSLLQKTMNEPEALEYLSRVKTLILEKFPEKEEQYRMIYERRFKRILLRKGIALSLY
ncbi:MAG: hypothetical protein H8D42_05595 [Candidatus Marinimicrobia bacterium]|nr:hypothetical protein [Candidatus Neomarinimicrobiota bacterium]MBL7066851.1 hypothetical protein [Candidatus Neomarinimicrobiota bacterium]